MRSFWIFLTLGTWFALPLTAQSPPLVVKVDHIIVVGGDSEKLFQFFRDKLQLPVAWPFTRVGDFGSGGVSVGNANLEFIWQKGFTSETAKFVGIALEPHEDAAAAAEELDRRKIEHDEPETYTPKEDGQIGWVTIGLPDVPPPDVDVFLIDYDHRDRVAASNTRARADLADRAGGPLGVVSAREIRIGVRSVDEASKTWQGLIDSKRGTSPSVIALGTGPAIHLVMAEQEGILGIVLLVKSTTRASTFLQSNHMLGIGDHGRVLISPETIDGLRIELTEE